MLKIILIRLLVFGFSFLNILKGYSKEKPLNIVCILHEADIIIYGHGRFDIPTAVNIGNSMSDFEILFFEEPIPQQNLEGLAEVKSRIKTRLLQERDFITAGNSGASSNSMLLTLSSPM